MHVTITMVLHGYVAANKPRHAQAACPSQVQQTHISALCAQMGRPAHVSGSSCSAAPVTTAAHRLNGAFVLYDAKAQQQQPGHTSAC